MVDNNTKDKINDNAKYVNQNEFSKDEINNAINYLQNNSKDKKFKDTYKQNMNSQQLFTATQEQKNNPDYTPSSTIGLGDMSLETIPMLKVGVGTAKVVGTATKEIAPKVVSGGKKVVKKVDEVYDDVTLGAIKKVNDVVPNTTNKFLNNPTKYTQGGIDAVESYLPGIPSPSRIGYGTALANELYNQLTNNENNKSK